MSLSTQTLASVDLHFDDGVVLARQRAREIADLLGFEPSMQTRIATAVSELARNAHRYAGGGRVTFSVDTNSLIVKVVDHGDGINELDAILAGEYQSRTGMGRGLVGVRRLMDSFEIATGPAGTQALASKRLPDGRTADDTEARRIRDELARRASRSAYDEVQEQNQELLQALNELKSRQDELVHLNDELADTNRGVVALYAELDERAEQLRDADGKKSRFLADMSHELRTPLNSIVALADLLRDGTDKLSSEQRTQIEFIRRMATDQLQLVGELLDIAKIEAGRLDIELKPVSVLEVIAALRIQLRPLVAGSDVSLRFSSEPGLPTLITDEMKLVQIMRNLVGNAVKYTQVGEVMVQASAVDGGLEFSVSDTGIGIADTDLARIFDEFVQIPGEHQKNVAGTGLGLPLTRKLADALGGSITAESEIGKGSRFVLTLPWGAQTETHHPREPAPVVNEQPLHLDLVLIADDDAAARYVVRRHLEAAVGEIVEVDGGQAALAFLEQRSPSAIVLDVSMPDLNGFEVLTQLRRMPGLEHVPVLLHTSQLLNPDEADRAATAGAVVANKADDSTGLLDALRSATEAGSSR